MKNAREIVEKLNGKWRGHEGRSYCPAHQDGSDTRKTVLSTRQAEGYVLFKCFAGCHHEEVRKALSGFVFGNKAPVESKAKKYDSTPAAFKILRESSPINGTIAEKYLRETRGLYHFGNTEDLRFHRAVKHSLEGGYAPALVAVIRNIQSWDAIGCHVTFLDKTGGKAALDPVKKIYGAGAGKGAIRLRQSQRPQAPAIIAEGIENALSLDLHLAKDYSVYAALNCHGLSEFHSACVSFEKAVIAGDKDEAGMKHAGYFQHFWRKKNKRCVVMYPPNATDWNDEILKKF